MVKFWKPENYAIAPVPDQPGMAALIYADPEPVSPEVEKRREEAANNLRDSAVVAWVTKSFQNRKPEEQISLPQAIAFAKSRDSAQLFDVVAEPGSGMTQICVVAAAAMAIRFSDDVNDLDWGWSIMDRVTALPSAAANGSTATIPTTPAFSTWLH